MNSANITQAVERLKEQSARYQKVLSAFKANCITMQNNLQRLEAALLRSKERASKLSAQPAVIRVAVQNQLKRKAS